MPIQKIDYEKEYNRVVKEKREMDNKVVGLQSEVHELRRREEKANLVVAWVALTERVFPGWFGQQKQN